MKTLVSWLLPPVVVFALMWVFASPEVRARWKRQLQPTTMGLTEEQRRVVGPRAAAIVNTPGLVGRQCGPVRLFVAVRPRFAATETPRVPIKVALDNDTYVGLSPSSLELTNDPVFQVAIRRVATGETVWRSSGPAGSTFHLNAVERREFSIFWPASESGTAPGKFAVEVTLGFGDRQRVVALTTLD